MLLAGVISLSLIYCVNSFAYLPQQMQPEKIYCPHWHRGSLRTITCHPQRMIKAWAQPICMGYYRKGQLQMHSLSCSIADETTLATCVETCPANYTTTESFTTCCCASSKCLKPHVEHDDDDYYDDESDEKVGKKITHDEDGSSDESE